MPPQDRLAWEPPLELVVDLVVALPPPLQRVQPVRVQPEQAWLAQRAVESAAAPLCLPSVPRVAPAAA